MYVRMEHVKERVREHGELCKASTLNASGTQSCFRTSPRDPPHLGESALRHAALSVDRSF